MVVARPGITGRRTVLFGLALGPFVTGGLCVAWAETAEGWVIEPDRARGLLADGALLLDARAGRLRAADPFPGAVAADWWAFAEPDGPDRGKLAEDDRLLTERLRALGVSAGQSVVVIGDPQEGWAEDARMIWTLRSLGHDRTYFVNGGAAALRAAGAVAVAPVAPGDITVARRADFEATREEVRAALGRPDVVILDAREPREFAGATPHGESRGGHVPGARSLPFRAVLGPDGRVRQGAALAPTLAELGLNRGSRVIVYCTGGVRAALVTMALREAGIDAVNYAGSMWEWSASPAEEFPLE